MTETSAYVCVCIHMYTYANIMHAHAQNHMHIHTHKNKIFELKKKNAHHSISMFLYFVSACGCLDGFLIFVDLCVFMS